MNPPHNLTRRGVWLRVLLPFAFGYFVANVFRTVNAVISGRLQEDVGVGAADLGLMTSAYFMAFALAQLPVGVLLDRHGPRRVEVALLLVAAAGAFIFAWGESLATLTFGRALIGLGFAACLMASFKAFSLWFEPSRLAMLNGSMMAVGAVGAMTATVPVQLFVEYGSWRGLFVVLAGLTLLAAAWLWFSVPERRLERQQESFTEQLRGLAQVLRSQPFWALAPLACISHGLGIAVMSLWAGPWMRDVAGMGEASVASALMAMTLAAAIGFAGWAAAADRLARRGVSVLMVVTVGAVLFTLASVAVALQPVDHVVTLWVLYALTATSGNVSYAVLANQYSRHLAGRVNAALNLAVFSGAFAWQWGMGVVVDAWPGEGGMAASTGYAVAFWLAAALQTVAWVWLLIAARRLRGSARAPG